MEADKQVLIRVMLLDCENAAEAQYTMKRLEVPQILTKQGLVKYVFNTVFERRIVADAAFVAQCMTFRKSKKHRRYVALDTPADFQDLKRSLRVKSHILLVVKSHMTTETKPEAQTGLNLKANKTKGKKAKATKDSKEKPEKDQYLPEASAPASAPATATSSAYASADDFDDPPVEEPPAFPRGELFNHAFYDFQNSGLWFGIRNLAASAAASHLEKKNFRVMAFADALNDNATAISQVLSGTASSLAHAINQNASTLADALNKCVDSQEPLSEQRKAQNEQQKEQKSQDEKVERFEPTLKTEKPKESSLQFVHENVTCDSCYPGEEEFFLTGVRYKCLVCENYDLCSNCFNSPANAEHCANHLMMAISVPREIYESDVRNQDLVGQTDLDSFISTHATHEEAQVLRSELKLRGTRDFLDYCSRLISSRVIVDPFLNGVVPPAKPIVETAQESEEEPEEPKESSEEPEELEVEVEEESEEVPEVEPKEELKITETITAIKRDKYVVTEAQIDLSLFPTGPNLATMRVTNKSDIKIFCEPVTVNFTNFLGKNVGSVKLSKVKEIKPRRSATFNINISSAHFKHPMRVSLRCGDFSGHLEWSVASFTGIVTLVKALKEQHEKEAATVLEKIQRYEKLRGSEALPVKAESTEAGVTSSEPVETVNVQLPEAKIEKCDSETKVIYPKLGGSFLKEGDLLYFESRSSLYGGSALTFFDDINKATDEKTVTDEYDIVSISETDSMDFDLDYEVLSPVVSPEAY